MLTDQPTLPYLPFASPLPLPCRFPFRSFRYAGTLSPGQKHPQFSRDTPRRGSRAVSTPSDMALGLDNLILNPSESTIPATPPRPSPHRLSYDQDSPMTPRKTRKDEYDLTNLKRPEDHIFERSTSRKGWLSSPGGGGGNLFRSPTAGGSTQTAREKEEVIWDQAIAYAIEESRETVLMK